MEKIIDYISSDLDLNYHRFKKFAFCKNNTVGTTEIYACGDMNPVTDSAQEAHESLVRG